MRSLTHELLPARRCCCTAEDTNGKYHVIGIVDSGSANWVEPTDQAI